MADVVADERLSLYRVFSRNAMEAFMERIHETSMRLLRLGVPVDTDII